EYRRLLMVTLQNNFGSSVQLNDTFIAPLPNANFGQVQISVGRRGESENLPSAAKPSYYSGDKGFSPISEILFDSAQSKIQISKPWTRIAWTIEQAYADAQGIIEQILRAGA